jgi:hypothetical protein
MRINELGRIADGKDVHWSAIDIATGRSVAEDFSLKRA